MFQSDEKRYAFRYERLVPLRPAQGVLLLFPWYTEDYYTYYCDGKSFFNPWKNDMYFNELASDSAKCSESL